MSKIVKKQTPDPGKRCYNRSWCLVYNCDSKIDQVSLCKAIRNQPHGICHYFSKVHIDPDQGTHIHVGAIFREEPKTLKWSDIKSYFTVDGFVPTEHSPILKKCKKLNRKLDWYHDYCERQEDHPGQDLTTPAYLWKYHPRTEAEKLGPALHVTDLIRRGLTIEQLDDLIESEETDLKVFKEALQKYDVYEKMISKFTEIRARKERAKKYKLLCKKQRPFQSGLSDVTETQNGRNIHCHHDPGDTGKNWWVDLMKLRTDTLILQNAETKRIAYAWDPRKHKRIIFDIPRGKMQFLNTSVVEKLKNGTLFSTMHKPTMKYSDFKPTIVILGNERIERESWTEDRATYSTTNQEYKLIWE